MMQCEKYIGAIYGTKSYYVLGTLGTNRVISRHKFGAPRHNCVFNCLYMTCEEDIHRANMIGELLEVGDGQLHLSTSQCEVRALIEYTVERDEIPYPYKVHDATLRPLLNIMDAASHNSAMCATCCPLS